MKRPDAIIARHFPTPLNESHVSRAWLPVGIDKEVAEPLAKKVAAIFKQYGVDSIVSSDLPRAEQSMELIADTMGGDIDTKSSRDLRTWNTGDMGGKKESETVPKRMKYIKYPEEKVPGGEPFQDFEDRFRDELNEIVDRRKQGEEIAMVGHGHHLLAAPHIMQDEDVDPEKLPSLDEDFKPGGVFLFFVQKDGSVKIETAGDTGDDDD